ncbi:MAG: hypothetical protein ACP5KS_12880, partial [Candidatus Hydrogenedens sp.]
PIKNLFIFKYQGGNFLFSKHFPKKKRPIVENNNPSNLIEFLSKKYRERSKVYKDSFDERDYYTNFYWYKERGSCRKLYYEKDSTTPTVYMSEYGRETESEYLKYGDPRYFIGYIGFTIDFSDAEDFSPPHCPGKKITELLDIPGETHVRNEGNYRILFHCVKIDCDTSDCSYDNEFVCRLIGEYEQWYSFEVWVDKHDNIVKIVEIDYLPIIYGETFVNKICGYTSGRFSPYEIRRVFNYEDFKEFPSGVRIPLKANIFINRNPFLIGRAINYEDAYVDNVNLIRDYKEKKITASEFRVLSHCYGTNENNYLGYITLEIDSDTLRVNEPIPEETFIAPAVQIDHRKEVEEDKKQKEKEKTNYIKPFLFVTFFTGVTILSIFITRRYLHWGI